MIQKLVWENMKHRPLRTFLSALLIAIPVTLVLTLTGLGKGMIDDYNIRTRGVGADVMIRPKGATLIGMGSANTPAGVVDFVRTRPHVAVATGVVMQSLGTPLSSAAGIDLDALNQMSGGFDYLSGGPFQSPDDVIVDEFYATEKKLHVGDWIELWNPDRKWRVSGIVKPGKLNHVFIDLKRLQDITSNSGKINVIYVKVDNPANLNPVIADLKDKLPGYPIDSMDEYVSLISYDSLPMLSRFTSVVVGVSIFIGFAVVCLSMYMAVLQRTREIGILKSLGASNWYVVSTILREAIMLAVVGTVMGVGMSFGAKWAIHTLAPASLAPAIDPAWWPRAAVIAIFGALLGALYPGLRAARMDPIEALSYE